MSEGTHHTADTAGASRTAGTVGAGRASGAAHTTSTSEKRAAFEPAQALFRPEDPRSGPKQRPISTTLGALFVIGRAVVGAIWVAAFVIQWIDFARDEGIEAEVTAVVLTLVGVVGGVGIIILLLLGWLIWRGSNAARVVTMCGLTLSIITAAVGYFVQHQEITIHSTLLTVAFDILVLLALSSRDARAWARSGVGRSARARKRAAARV